MSFFEEGGRTHKPEQNIRVDVYVHGLPLGGSDSGTSAKLEQIIVALAGLKTQGAAQTQEIQKMAGEIDTLTAEVARNTEVDNSVVILVEGLAAKIEALKNNPVALQALADSLKASSDKVAAAVVAHTPAEEPPA